jgi:putative transposase
VDSTRWRLIKTGFTKIAPTYLGAHPTAAPDEGEQAVWQHRYWEHQIRDEADFARHVDYIHYNPVRHGLARAVLDWPYSSFGRYVEAGVYASDWGGGPVGLAGVGRE